MSKNVEFFRCFSINLHNFIKASGVRYMNNGVHDTGIDVSKDGGKTWDSYSSIHQASKETGLSPQLLQELRTSLINDSKPTSINTNDLTFKKRIRFYWVYEMTEDLEKALKIWNKTGPRSTK